MEQANPGWNELLATHYGALRQIAWAILRDEHAADDTLQDAWLVVRRGAPATHTQALGWLREVVRSLARKRRRSKLVRDDHESRRAAETTEVDDESRHEIAVVIQHAVASLPEDYRRLILLRYFDGLTGDAIASKLGISLPTVQRRHHVALRALRVRVDRELAPRHGSGRNALIALVGPSSWRSNPTASAPSLGSSSVFTKVAVYASATSLIVAGWLWLPRDTASMAVHTPEVSSASSDRAAQLADAVSQTAANATKADEASPQGNNALNAVGRHRPATSRVIWQSPSMDARAVGPRGLAVAPSGQLFAISYDDRSVLAFDAQMRRAAQSLPLDYFSVAVFCAGRLFVTAPGGELVAIDATSLARIDGAKIRDPKSRWLVNGLARDRFDNLHVLSSDAGRVFCFDHELHARYDWAAPPGAILLSGADDGLLVVLSQTDDASVLEFLMVTEPDKHPIPDRGLAICGHRVVDIALTRDSLFVATDFRGIFQYKRRVDEQGIVREIEMIAVAPHGLGLSPGISAEVTRIAIDESRRLVFLSYGMPAGAVIALSLDDDFVFGTDLDDIADPIHFH